MAQFDYFVVFAEMRTGSNFLETNINKFDGLSCHGEAFNPYFIGYPEREEILGITQAARDKAPLKLIDAMIAASGLNGFRFFNDHDSRVLDICLADPRCAKVVLTRNPIESFVSWKIATATGQWKLTNVNNAKNEQVKFDPDEFKSYLAALQAFQVRLMKTLQRTGQTAFYLAYEDLQDRESMNGLAAFLGCDDRIVKLNKSLKKQNPAPLSVKVANYKQMSDTLAQMDYFNLTRTPNFEPRRGPMIPTFFAGARTPLVFMPLKSGPTDAVLQWLAGIDGGEVKSLQSEFTQKTLRDWKRIHTGHRSFTVLRHPVARAHSAFCDRILATGPGTFPEIRTRLRKLFNLKVPDHGADPETDPEYDLPAHRAAFLAFLNFLRGNLAAQTSIRVDAAWASQLSLLQSMADFGLPDMILREDTLAPDLAILAGQMGLAEMPALQDQSDPLHQRLSAIYDAEVEVATRDAYARDYADFGFGDWPG